MSNILIVTYTSGYGDPFAADSLETVIDTLQEIHGGQLVESLTTPATGNTNIEWADDCDCGFHVWVEKGHYIKSYNTIKNERAA